MTKKKKKKYSRLNPAYLASRHAGAFFMFLALGLLGGLAWRTLVQPTHYAAHYETSVTLTPPGAAVDFDWAAKQNEWNGWLQTRRDRGLLAANLRFAVKLAATRNADIDTELLGEELAAFASEARFSASLLPNRFLARLGPVLAVSRSDLASYMDFQSLASIIADLDPSHEHADAWDFSFFRNRDPEHGGIIAKPGPDDPFFQVFHTFHEIVRGQPADSPVVAWRTAVDEFAARLDREASFAGGGGFGPVAKREIVREIMAIPALAANGLYRVNDCFTADSDYVDAWGPHWDSSSSVTLLPASGNVSRVIVAAGATLHPVAYRRDTVYTRLPPLTIATLISFLAAREDKGEPLPLEVEPVPVAPGVNASAPETAADFVAELDPLEPAADTADAANASYREIVDEAAAQERLALIAKHETSVTTTRIQHAAVVRRLAAARDTENRLSREAVAARVRADRLRERYDAATVASEQDNRPHIPPETAQLFRHRDEVFARLTTLLQYCTEEHPFVRQARRELGALETQLAGHSPDDEANRAAEARATLAASLHLEWETAVEQADALEERQRRQHEESAALLDAVTGLEQCVLQFERELALAKESPIPVIRQELRPLRPVEPVESTPAPVAPPPSVAPAPLAVPTGAHLVFASLPIDIPLEATTPDWRALWYGLAAGLCCGILWILLREAFASRFRNAFEARRMVRLPVLAELPAYDMRSLKTAASSMKGEVVRTPAGKRQFIPSQVEYSEPPPEARRGKIIPAARRPRFMAWVLCLLFLILAFLLYHRSLTGFAQPRLPGDARALSLPGITFPAWIKGGNKQEWGNLP